MAKGFGLLDAIVSVWMPNDTLHSFLKDPSKVYPFTEQLSIVTSRRLGDWLG